VRWSQVELDFKQQNFGQLSSRPDASVPYASVAGQGKDKPLTPKYGLQYQLTPGSMLYATAAKGFRAGGANVPLNPQVCATGLALFGITVDDIPKQYGPDLVMSYEVGGKFRMFDNTLQVNVAAFQIDWTDIQVTNSAQNCGQNWNQNGGKARSTGYDLQVDYRPIQALTINAALGVVDAKYREAVTGPKPLTGNAAIAINKGDPLGVPDFQANGGARFEFAAFDHKAYVRADYIYQGSYLRGVSYGAANYNPYTRNVDATDQVNARLGVNLDGWDVNLYANNLLNGNDKVGNSGNGKSACNAATGGVGCTVYGTYSPFVTQSYQKPRTIGLQANYKF
jgi:outer membrane receptor protein involved in Fe transport